jgi:hypothetical protein
MPEENRLRIDSSPDTEVVKNNLLKDVAEATKQAKQRKADDKARAAGIRTKAAERAIMYIIVVLAAAAIFWAAYWLTFVRGAAPKAQPRPAPVQTRPTPVYQRAPQYLPRRPAPPPSEPVRRTPTDTYDEGPEPGGM